MPTLRDHLAAQDAGRGGGHHGGGHHGGGHHHGGGRGRGGVVFYDRSPDVVVVEADCPPGFYYDDFGNCRPLPYHSMNVGSLGRRTRARGPSPEPGYTARASEYIAEQRTEADTKAREAALRDRELASPPFPHAGHFDSRMRPLPCPETSGIADMMPAGPAYDMRRATHDAAGDAAVPVGWFNPFDPFGSGKAYQTTRERDALDAEIMTTDARVASAQKGGAKIPNEIIFDYVAFRKDWDAVKVTDVSNVQLSSMRARFRAELDALSKYMKVDDLRPPESPAQTIPKVIDEFGTSIKTVGVASALAIVAVAIVGAIVVGPHIGPALKGSMKQSRENAKLAAKFAR